MVLGLGRPQHMLNVPKEALRKPWDICFHMVLDLGRPHHMRFHMSQGSRPTKLMLNVPKEA